MSEQQPLVDTKKTGDGSSQANAEIHDRTGLFIAIVALVVGCLGIGFGIASIIIIDNASQRANVAENHWRNDEVEIMNLRNRVTTLEAKENARH